jgi:thioredoxin reductase (NADPH)
MKEDFELAIIGAGIAGVSAAIYAKRAGLKFSIFEPKAIGGQLLLMETVDNYTGINLGTKAQALAASLSGSLSQLAIEPVSEEVLKIEQNSRGVRLFTQENKYCGAGLIVATGASFKRLAINKEEEFTGKGVSYCAVCDGFFFRNKTVAVIGGGNTAAEEALYLSNICKKVYLIHRKPKLRSIEYLQKEIFLRKNIEVIFDSAVKEINGTDFLESITIENIVTKKISGLNINGLFIAIGVKPNTELFKDIIRLDEGGFILTNEAMKTSLDFIWAAGDCRQRPLRQLITASSEGAIAAVSAYKYLKGGYISA